MTPLLAAHPRARARRRQAAAVLAARRLHRHVRRGAPQHAARARPRRLGHGASAASSRRAGCTSTTPCSASSAMVVAGILEFAVQPAQPVARDHRLRLRRRRGAHAGRVRPHPAPRGRVLDRRGPEVHRRRHPRAHVHDAAAHRAAAAEHRPRSATTSPSRAGLAFALILSGAVFVVVCYLKGKLFMGTVGIFVPPVAFIGAAAAGQAGLAVGAPRSTPAAPPRWSGRAAATRASTRRGSGASTACGTSSAASRTSRCRIGTATATATAAVRAAAPRATSASRTCSGASAPAGGLSPAGRRPRRRPLASRRAPSARLGSAVEAEGEPQAAVVAVGAEAPARREGDAVAPRPPAAAPWPSAPAGASARGRSRRPARSTRQPAGRCSRSASASASHRDAYARRRAATCSS